MVQDSTLALTDTLLVKEPQYGLLLTAPEAPPTAEMRDNDNFGSSLILCGLFILFLVIALRFRNNMKYVGALFRNLVDVRTRHNVFDDTVRETSLIVLLNLLWCGSAGVIAYAGITYFNPELRLNVTPTIGMLLGMAMAMAYTLFMCGAYLGVGWVFSDRDHARLWFKGFTASQALMTPLFFVIALLAICWIAEGLEVVIIASIVFLVARLVFIWKGYRIFFSQISSWVLFLCYLCSLEIIPLVLTYRLACLLAQG